MKQEVHGKHEATGGGGGGGGTPPPPNEDILPPNCPPKNMGIETKKAII